MVRYTEEEKKDMYDVYIRCYRNETRSAQTYLDLYPDRQQPSKRMFSYISKNMAEHSSVKKRRTRYQVRHTDNEINVLAQIHINPENSTRRIAKECVVGTSTVKRILKKHKYHGYKFQKVQKLHAGDSDRRLMFCRWYSRKLRNDRSFNKKILWTDECSFTNSGIFNPRNKHLYATSNPHLIREVRPQFRFTQNVWCGLINNQIIGPIFLDGNLNQFRYLHLLEEVLDEMPLQTRQNLQYFMQDGCGAHNARRVAEYLDQYFRGNWIGTNGPIRWPPRSPCLNPMDYFVWGFVKNQIYDKNMPNNLQELRQRIVDAFEKITPEMVDKTTSQMSRRIALCIQQNGLHFEQLL